MSADSSLFVIVLGLATTFFGLICIIMLSKVMSYGCSLSKSLEKEEKRPESATCVPSALAVDKAKRGEFVAVISAAIAEDMGKDVSSIRILSIKKV